MLSTIKSIALHGLEGELIDVQVDVSAGLPSWEMVGLPDASIRESKERVRTAIKNSGFEIPSRKVVINLAPADLRKEGTYFDLAITIGLLYNLGIIERKIDSEIAFIGELSLDGKLNKVNGILPMCLEAKKLGIKKVIVPLDNVKEGAVVRNIEVIGVKDIKELVDYLNKKIIINSEKYVQTFDDKENIYNLLDFSEVKGQEKIKRALEVAAAGGHNCLLAGNPGSGKTMMAKRIATILPDLSFDESLEITKIYSISGLISKNKSIIMSRPFRSPHYTISPVSLIGGGKYPKPGEISLAHYGVLYLDELPEFDKKTLEYLRSPLEDGVVTISRVNATLTYPCKCMLVASMNLCPCGKYSTEDDSCNCSQKSIEKYLSKISGPLLDRIDIQVEVSSVNYQNMKSSKVEESSAEIKSRVNKARKIQNERYKLDGIFSNSELTARLINKYCILNDEAEELLKNAFIKMNLSARGYSKILKIARTIADLDNKKIIEKEHIAEAIQYRKLDKKYWGN